MGGKKGKKKQNSLVNKRRTHKRRVGWRWRWRWGRGYVVLVLVAAAVADRRFGPRPPSPPLTPPHGCGSTNSQSHTAASCPPTPNPPPTPHQSRFLFSSSHTLTSHVRRPLGQARNGAAAAADGKSEGSQLSAQPWGPAAPPPPLPTSSRPVPSPSVCSLPERRDHTDVPNHIQDVWL